jgi:NAD(P)-binding Rossmann-like domain
MFVRLVFVVVSIVSSVVSFTTTLPSKVTKQTTRPPVSIILTKLTQKRFASIVLPSTSSSDTVTVEYEDLSLPARPGRPMKVAIAGGGVGGLTTALCLLKKGFDVTVYEKTAAFARFGGPIQFASNALSVLKEIDDTLFTRVMEKFTFTGTRACGIKDGLRADGSFRMTNDSLDYLWNPDAPADWFVKFPLKVRSFIITFSSLRF